MKQTDKSVSPMSNEGRNTYVIEHIRCGLLSLLEEKKLEEISISELCDKAQVGRASFYRNYESKEDILREYLRQLFKEWTSRYDKSEDIPLSEQMRSIFAHFENHREFYELLNKRELTYLLKDVILGIFDMNPDDDKIAAYMKAYVAYLFYGFIDTWFRRGMKESADEMAALFAMQGKQ